MHKSNTYTYVHLVRETLKRVTVKYSTYTENYSGKQKKNLKIRRKHKNFKS